MKLSKLISLVVLTLLFACTPVLENDAETGLVDPAASVYSQCEAAEHVGNVSVILDDEYTSIQGMLTSGVIPFSVLEVTLTEGDCVFLHPKELFCDPACEGGETCDESGDCIPYPTNIDIGTLTIHGLSAAVVMDPIVPSLIYYFSGDLPHPGFETGDPIELSSTGAEQTGPFSMVAYGITGLEVAQTEMELAPDQPSMLEWTPSTSDVDRRIQVAVNIANHGGTPARIECEVFDEGTLEIPTDLVNALLNVGYSGFPSVKLTRLSADTTTITDGCIDFTVLSSVTLPIEIPGLTSCSSDDDCPKDQTCLPDLSCG